MRVSVRRLAALDMHGRYGRRWRQWLITAEFIVGVLGCSTLGILSLAQAAVFSRALGAWLLGVSLNYLPLAIHAASLLRDDRLKSELPNVDLAEFSRYARLQFLIAVPGALALLGLMELARTDV